MLSTNYHQTHSLTISPRCLFVCPSSPNAAQKDEPGRHPRFQTAPRVPGRNSGFVKPNCILLLEITKKGAFTTALLNSSVYVKDGESVLYRHDYIAEINIYEAAFTATAACACASLVALRHVHVLDKHLSTTLHGGYIISEPRKL